jgi:type I restriction enzyme, S subunit
MEKIKLRDICDLQNGYVFKSEDYVDSSNTVNCRMSNIRPDATFDIEYNIRYLPDSYADKYSDYLLNDGDLIIAMTDLAGDPKILGVPTIVETKGYKLLLNQRVGKLIIKNKNYIYERYLKYALSLPQLKSHYEKFASGGLQINIGKEQVLDAEIQLTDYNTQIKIVNILDKSKDLIDKRKTQIEALDELVKSRFIEMFGDLKSNSKHWNVLEFDSFATIDTKMTKDFEKYKDYPHIGIDCIEKNTGRILDYKLVKDSELISGKYIFDKRHVIYSKIRPNLNKVALPEFNGVCSADAYPILCNDKVVIRSYLGYVLRSEFFLSYILAFSGRTNIPKVNKEQIKGFKMPTPPIQYQNQFDDFVIQVDKLKFAMEKSLKELENNFNSLMQRAFNGELFN